MTTPQYERLFGFILGDMVALKGKCLNCSLQIKPAERGFTAVLKKQREYKGKLVWEKVQEYHIDFELLNETPEYPRISSPSLEMLILCNLKMVL